MPEKPITIEKLAFGGSGIGRIDGKVCFVPFSCPGDELSVRITGEKRSYLTAAISEIRTASPHRVTPPCSLFGVCGGCDWQHVAYEQQLEAKRTILADALWRGARVPGELIAPTAASPRQYGYRSRVQFKLFGYSDSIQIGFFRQGSHYVEDAPEGCPIAAPAINQVLQLLRILLADFPEPTRIPQINIDSAEEGLVAIVHYIGDQTDSVARFFREHQQDLAPLKGLFLQTGRKSTLMRVWGDGRLVYTLPRGDFHTGTAQLGYRPGGFSQINAEQNRRMLELARSFAGLTGSERLLDLYCGNGNFSIPLADDAAVVTGIEEYGDSIAAAVDNARANGIHNTEFICADALAGTTQLVEAGRQFDVVVLDPPRAGAREVLPQIDRLRPEKIIYISCDPATLARDCGELSSGGYRVQASVPVDMFPQTYHLESVTLLTRV